MENKDKDDKALVIILVLCGLVILTGVLWVFYAGITWLFVEATDFFKHIYSYEKVITFIGTIVLAVSFYRIYPKGKR